MKRLLTILAICGVWLSSSAQESMEMVIEKRAREMHRVICLTNKDEWVAFVKGNFTQALINKPMRVKTETGDGESSNSASKTADNPEAKADIIFKRLNSDFGKSKIESLKPNGSSIELVLKDESGMRGTFTIKFDAKDPYLIDGIVMEVNAGD